jgi:hypothetical protein
MEYWSIGGSEYWSNGVLECWSVGKRGLVINLLIIPSLAVCRQAGIPLFQCIVLEVTLKILSFRA